MSINISQLNAVISKYLKKLGKPVTAVVNGNVYHDIYAVIEPTWKRDKSRFENERSSLGGLVKEYCEYFGPTDFDITQMSETDYICLDDTKYCVLKAQKVSTGGCVQYYTGILKRIIEEDGNVFR